MNKYSKNISADFFNHEFCLRLKNEIDNILEKVGHGENILPEYHYTHHTKILFYDHILDKLPEISTLIDRINATVISVPILGFVPPNSKMGVHKDGYNCLTKIMLPIMGNYPLSFFENKDDTTPSAITDINIFSPIIFNSDQWHGGVLTNNEWRVNFQIMIAEPYNVIEDRVENNTLFKLQ